MTFIGNQKIVNLLSKSLEKGRIAQAYIFSGPEAVGKFTLAKIFAQALIQEENVSSTDTSILRINRIMELNENQEKLLDLMVIEPEREEKKGILKIKDIKIERVREAQKFLLTFPARGKYKVLIINDAHRLTEAAQNSLLKIMEEPNSTSVIILITHRPRRLLPTLKSRAQTVNFALAGNIEMERGLKEVKAEPVSRIIELSLGRPGLALKLAQSREKIESLEKSLAELEGLKKMGIGERLKIAEIMAKNTAEAVKKLNLWIWILRQPQSAAGKINPENYRAIESIEKCVADITGTNANARLVLENLLLNWE